MKKILLLIGLFAALYDAPLANADEAVATGWLGGYSKILHATNFTGTATASDSGLNGAYNASASRGRIDLSVHSFPAAYPNNSGYAIGGGSWNDTVTIQPDNPALLGTGGTAVFTYHLNGSASSTDFTLCQFNVGTECECGGPSTYSGTPIVSSFTITRSFTFGVPFQLFMSLSSNEKGNPPEYMDVSLTAGNMTVSDSGANPTTYTSTSSTGSAHARVFTNADSYAGFTLTNTVGHQTMLSILDGTASSNQVVIASFTGNNNTNELVSDVADFSGTDTNLFVLQMSFDALAAAFHLGNETNAMLEWFNPVIQAWTNAISGNSDGGLASHFFLGAFNPATEFALGNFGVDTDNHVAWAVVNHNSLFAVGGVAIRPVFHWTAISPQTNVVSLSLQAPSNSLITVESSSDLSTTNWSVLGVTVPDINGVASINDTNSASTFPQRFYRAHQP